MRKDKLRNVIIFALVLISDQLTKVLAYRHLIEGVEVPVIPGFFNLTLVYNPGAAFGMFGGLPDFWRRLVLIVVSCVALLVVLRFLLIEAREDPWSQAALAGILAGAVGNIVDRFRFDAVVDFIDLYIQGYPHWPAFNIADSAISVGVFVLVFRVLFSTQDKQSADSSED